MYWQRDTKLALIQCPELVAQLQAGSVHDVRDRLISWADSHRELMEERVPDMSAAIQQAKLWVLDACLGNRLVLKLDSKEARDEVVR